MTHSRFELPKIVAVVSSDHMAAVIVATDLRRADWPTETFLTGNRKKQFKKAMEFEVAVLLDDTPQVALDVSWGGRVPFGEGVRSVVTAVKLAYEGARPGEYDKMDAPEVK